MYRHIPTIETDKMYKNAMNLLKAKAEEYNKAKRSDDRKWIAAELNGMCQAFCMCGVISALDWQIVEDGMK